MLTVCDGPAVDVFEVQKQLRASAYAPVRTLFCQAERDRVVVMGTVPCYYMRQIAESLAAKVVGVDHLESQIKVARG